MNKKVKSLLIAGVMVLGMSGNVFAYNTFEGNDSNTGIAGEQHDEMMESKIDDPRAGESYTLQNGAIVVTISDDGKYATVTVDPEATVKVTHIHMKGGNKFNCYVVGEDGLVNMVCPENNGGNVPKISHISVFFDHVDPTDTDGDGVPDYKDDEPTPPVEPEPEPPVEPEDPEIHDPETGDSSLMLATGATVVSAAGLYFVTKKKDEE